MMPMTNTILIVLLLLNKDTITTGITRGSTDNRYQVLIANANASTRRLKGNGLFQEFNHWKKKSGRKLSRRRRAD